MLRNTISYSIVIVFKTIEVVFLQQLKEANDNVDSAESSYEEKYLEAQRTEQNVKSMEAKVKELIKLTDISSQESFYAL